MSRSPTTPFNYSVPVGTTAVSGQVISSVAYNNFLADLTNNLANAAWPITYGGTGTADGSSLVPDGSAATPAMRFQNETNTGFYRVAAGQLGVSIQGVNVGTFTSTGLSITNPISITGSSAGFTPFTGISTASGAAAGPIIELYRNNTAAANNVDGRLLFTGQNSTPAKVTYAFEQQVIVSPTAGAEYGAIDHYAKINGTDTRIFSVGPNNPNTPSGFVDGYATTATAAGTTSLTVTSAKNQYFTGTTTQTVVLPVVTTLPQLGWQSIITNNSTGAVTVQSSGANTILVVGPGQKAIFTCILLTGTTAASWDAKVQSIYLAVPVASTSGTSIAYTGLPAGVKRVTALFNGTSLSGTAHIVVQIGAAAVETSGYLGSGSQLASGSSVLSSLFTNGFGIYLGAAAGVIQGALVLTMSDPANPTWIASGSGSFSNGAANWVTGGSKTLSSGPLGRLTFTTSNGTDTFDAGSVNLMWEF